MDQNLFIKSHIYKQTGQKSKIMHRFTSATFLKQVGQLCINQAKKTLLELEGDGSSTNDTQWVLYDFECIDDTLNVYSKQVSYYSLYCVILGMAHSLRYLTSSSEIKSELECFVATLFKIEIHLRKICMDLRVINGRVAKNINSSALKEFNVTPIELSALLLYVHDKVIFKFIEDALKFVDYHMTSTEDLKLTLKDEDLRLSLVGSREIYLISAQYVAYRFVKIQQIVSAPVYGYDIDEFGSIKKMIKKSKSVTL